MSLDGEYNDNTVLLSGAYKKFKLCDIPANYFLRIYTYPKTCGDLNLIKYIKNNIDKLEAENQHNHIKHENSICRKYPYPSKSAARMALRDIRKAPGKNTKPVRSYECPKCNFWHLTSMPIEVWKKIKCLIAP